MPIPQNIVRSFRFPVRHTAGIIITPVAAIARYPVLLSVKIRYTEETPKSASSLYTAARCGVRLYTSRNFTSAAQTTSARYTAEIVTVWKINGYR